MTGSGKKSPLLEPSLLNCDMITPIKRKRTRRKIPINVDSLLRKWENGDNRINGYRIEDLLNRWYDGEKVNWRKLRPTFFKRGPRNPAPA